MNCKKDDLARVVPINPEDEWARGHIARCVEQYTSDEGVVGWVLDPVMHHPNGKTFDCAADAILRPITPPPGSVTDSEVSELYDAPKLPEVTV